MMSFQKRKIFVVILIILLFTILQTGCAFKDIDKRVFVLAIGIDPAEDNEKKYKVTLKISLPTGSIKDSQGPKFTYLSHEAETIGESVRILETHIDKVLEFSHTKLIIINEKLLSENLSDFMDYFTRRGDIQLIAYIAAARPSAEKILKTEVATESPASISLFNIFDSNGTESPYIITTFHFEFRRDFHGKGINAILPIIESSNDDTQLIVNKSIVVKEKEKPLDLSSVETKQFNTLDNKKSGFDYKVENDKLTLLLNINRIKMNYKIVTDKGKEPRIDMKVTMVGTIGEANKELYLKDLNEYNEFANKEFKEKVIKLLKKFQENEVDPFGFGLRYRATRLNDENTYSDWEQIYPTINFNVSVNVKLNGTGAIE